MAALQTAVAALENNDYVTKVEEYKENGVAVGYKIYFSKGTEAIIYHGAKGDQGDKGEDGVTPTVSINEQGYWVINGQVTDVKALGVDGVNGTTPSFNIVDGKWMISYDNGGSWTEVGQATGDQGPQGPQGADGVTGDAFIHSIKPIAKDGETVVGTFAEAWYIRIILNDNTETLEDNPSFC